MSISIVEQNHLNAEYKNIAETLSNYSEEYNNKPVEAHVSIFEDAHLGIFAKAKKVARVTNGAILEEVIIFNNMQNKMRISGVYV